MLISSSPFYAKTHYSCVKRYDSAYLLVNPVLPSPLFRRDLSLFPGIPFSHSGLDPESGGEEAEGA